MLKDNGEEVPILKTVVPRMLGGHRYLIESFVDISDRRQVEESLARERDLLQALMDNVPDMIFFKDAESRVIRSNRAHAQLLGFDDPQEAIGKTDFDFFAPEDAPGFYEEEQEIIRSGRPIIDRIGQTPDLRTGELRWLSETKVAIRSKSGQELGLVGIARDITERKRAETELERRSAQLQTAAEVSPRCHRSPGSGRVDPTGGRPGP